MNISETIAGYQSNRSPLLVMLTEPTFCRNSPIHISIDNRFYNRFIHLGRPVFTLNHNDTSVFTIPTTFGIAHARVTLARHRSPNLRPEYRIIATRQLDRCFYHCLLFRQPIASPIIVFTSSPTCLLVQTQLQSI